VINTNDLGRPSQVISTTYSVNRGKFSTSLEKDEHKHFKSQFDRHFCVSFFFYFILCRGYVW